MPIRDENNEARSETTAKERAFEYQLQTLKLEMEYIEHGIARLDEMTQTTKHWAILVWTGSIGLILGRQVLQQYILFTAIIPLLFWLVDARWRYWLGHFAYRQKKISDFINSPELPKVFEQQTLCGFTVLDPLGKSDRETPEFKKKRTFWRAFKTAEVSLLYGGMFIISIAAGVFFLVMPRP